MLPSLIPTTVVGWHQSRGASEPDAKAASRSCSFLLSPTASLTSAIAACVCVHGGCSTGAARSMQSAGVSARLVFGPPS